MTCRICLDDEKLDDLVQPCNCNTALVHKECLLQWLHVSGHTACEICTFEYDIVDVEETKHTWCPKYRFSENMEADAIVIIIGIIGHFFLMFSVAFWVGTTLEDIFIYENFCQGMFILMLHKHINPREVLFFWKICSCICLYILSQMENDYQYVICEFIITFLIGLYTYTSLVRSAKQTVRYINIEDRQSNEHMEAVQGP